jgi:photosystem II stability/assembly factor-like uncharacterized protein
LLPIRSIVSFFDDQFGIAIGPAVIFKTEDAGQHWTLVDTTLFPEVDFRAIAIDSTVVGPVAVAVGSELTVIRSADRGVTWRNVHQSVDAPLHGACSLGDGRFAAFVSGGWLAESSDTGLSWQTRLIFPATDMTASACLPSETVLS